MRFFTNKLFLFFLLVSSLSGYAQTVNYTSGPMNVDVFISNRCAGTNNGSLIFTVNSTSVGVGGSVNIQIFGPVNLVIPQTVLVGNTFTFNAAQTLPAGTYNLIIVDNDDNSNIINTFGGDPPAVISDLPIITLTDGAGTNLVNSDCTTPNGGIEVSLSGGSQVLAGGGSYTYTFSATNGLAGLPLTGTFDGTTSLNLATLLGLGGLPGGDYTLVIDDDYSRCGATRNWTITDPQPSLQSITNPGAQTICTGQNATVNLGGSELGVTYEVLVNGVATGVTQVGTGAAISFSVPSGLFATGQVLSVVARFGSCSPRIMTGAITMTVRPLPTAVVSGGGTVCAGGTLPNVTFTFTGTAPFTFTYTDGVTPVTVNNHPTTTFTITNAPAGTYQVTALSDANTCVATNLGGTVSVIVNPLPTATISGGGPVCSGAPLPNVVFTFTGTAPFTFTFTNGVTPVTVNNHPTNTFTINNAPAGAYSITALSDANCVGTSFGTPVSVVVNPLPTAVVSGGGTVCAGATLPNVVFTFTGTAPFTFTYTDGVTPVTVNNHPTTTFTINNAPAGTYQVTALSDANTCAATSLGGTANVIVNPLPTATISGGGPVCAGAPLPNVVFTFTGTAPFTFTYTNGVTPVTVNNHPTNTFTINSAPAGTYSITALSDANCVGTSLGTPVSVVVNALPTAVVSGGGPVCSGAPLPNVTFTFTGTAPFTFTYTDGVTPVTVTNHPTTTFIINNAPAGAYRVTALTDANSCAATSLGGTVNVIVNALPTATISGGGPVCAGAPLPNVVFTFTGTAPFTFTFTNGVTPVTVNNHPTNTFTINNAPAGTYSITALSDANCVGTSFGTPVIVTVNPLPTAVTSGGGIVCAGAPLPNVTFTFTGTAPFTFTYTDGVTPVTVNNHPTTTFTINNAPAGAYRVTALTDANSCAATSLGGTVNVIVNALPTATISGGGPVCAGSPLPNVVFTFTDTAPFTFTYTDGVTPVTVNNHPTTSFTIPNAPAGTYSITALSDANCVGTSFGTPVIVTVNALPTATTTGGGTICAGAALPNVVFTFTGTAPFTFTYTDGVTPVTVNNHPTTSFTLPNAPAGTYQVTALTDASCAATNLGGTVSVIVNALPTATISGGGPVCAGSPLPNVVFTFTGTAPFTFTYTDGVTPVTVNNHPTTSFTIPNAPAGTYSITALSDANCVGTSFGTPVIVTVNALPTATTTGGGTICAGAALPNVVFTFTGTAPFTFTYTDGTTPVTVNNHPTTSFTLTNAPAGTYQVTALTDASCAATSLGGTVSVIVNALPTATITGGGPVCTGLPLPNVTFNFTGTAPFTFTYTDGTTPVTVNNHPTASFTITNAPAGTYSITALSDANCVGTSFGTPVSVITNALPTATTTGGGTVCAGAPLPSVTFTFAGTAPFTFTYTDGVTPVTVNNHPTTTFTIPNAPVGTYQVTALSDAGCTATSLGGAVSVVVNALPTATTTGGGTVCTGAPLPNVTFTFTGTAPFTFTYTDGTTPVTVNNHPTTSFTLTNAPAGTYQVTALTDANCNATSLGATASVITNVLPTATTTGGGTVCAGAPLPNVTFTFTGTAPFNFTYTDGTTPVTVNSHGTTTFTLVNAPAGTYQVTALTDANCTATSLGGTASVIVNPLPTAGVGGGGPVCAGSPLPNVTFTFTGTAPFNFTYTDGTTPVTVNNHPTTSFTITNAPAGTYQVTALTDASTCSATTLGGSVTVIVNPLPDASFTGLNGPYCLTAGAVTLTPATAGGTFSGPGISGNIFTPATAGVGTHTIQYQVTAGGCTDLTTQTVDVLAVPDATINAAGPFCASDAPVTLTAATPGGTWSGPGITDAALGTFDPSVAGPGLKTITYQVSAGGCTSTDTQNITVFPAPNATITPVGPFCTSDGAVNLIAATSGGTWSGTGITDPVLGTFDPATAGAGTHTITYSITVGSCSDTKTLDITVATPPDATITPAGPLCTSDAIITLVAATPGGTWSGTGITNPSTGTFDPATAGAGTFTITYSITIGGCSDTKTTSIQVDLAPDATITAAGPFCTLDAAVNLVAATAGGTWSGTGITDPVLGTFDPATAGAGSHVITYSITSGSCSDLGSITIDVATPPDATITAVGPFCTNDAPVTLVAATTGGTWSGTGITDPALGTFDPATAGAGTFTITYSITIGGCSDTKTTSIQVDQAPDATITAAGPFCTLDAAVNLVAVTAGGTWSGTGITDPVLGTFDPATAGAGSHVITYSVTTGLCSDTDNITIVVATPPDATITSAGPFCTNDAAVNLVAVTAGGTWSGTGITDPALGTFDPATAGAGTFTITYSITIGGCSDTKTTSIQVDQAPDATITAVGPFCTLDGAVNIIAATAGGTWSGTGITDPVLGTFDPATAGAGSHVITYSVTTGSCSDTDNITVVVATPPDATIAPAGPFCTSDVPVTLLAATPGGTWSGTGITSASAGTFSPAAAGAGTFTITYSITIGGCSDTKTIDIVVNSSTTPVINPVGPFCLTSSVVNLTANVAGGTWSGTGITDPVNGTFNPATAGTGVHVITYSLGGSCSSSATTNIIVNTVCGGLNCFAFTITTNTALTQRPSCSDQDDGVIALNISTVSGGNIIVQLISPVDTITQVAPGGLFTFPGLSPANYQYKVTDAFGNVCQQPFSLPLQTIVEATADASSFVGVSCFGDPSGKAIINATGSQTGDYFYSINGTDWTQFVPGNIIDVLPPNGTYTILVGESIGDACRDTVEVTINNLNLAIDATFTITDATCNGNDGAITNIAATGGSGGPYQFSLDGIVFQAANSFNNRPGGLDTLIVRDASGCVRGVPFNVTFPGFVNFVVNKQNADCTNNGVSGFISVDITDVGSFRIALSTDQFNEPDDADYMTYNEPFVTFNNLSRGQYFIYVKSNAAACPTRSAPIDINGVQAISFDVEYSCTPSAAPDNDKPVLRLTNLVLDPLLSFDISIYKGGIALPVITHAALNGATTIEFLYDDHVFMQTPDDDYEIEISQIDGAAFCQIVSERTPFVVPRRLSVFIDGLNKSYPDIPTGTMQITHFDGGIIPYNVRIELDSASSFDLPSFETNFEEVGLNSNLQFEKDYKNLPAGRYTVEIVDSVGCSIERTALVPLDTDIFVPNIFTPNDDGVNDEFFIRNLPAPGAKLIVTNRWGKEVFSSNDYKNDWKGDGVSDGIYFYRLQGGDATPVTGWVEILRGQKP